MRIPLVFSIVVSLFTSTLVRAEEVETIDGANCRQGIHKQPGGIFAIHVFCDDALGTNVAIFINHLGAPISGKYDLGKRFWQAEEWSYDVTSFSWLEENRLLLATSHVYGSGKVYRLDLESQTYEVLKDNDENTCLAHIKSIGKSRAKIGLTNCETQEEQIVDLAL